MSCLVSEVQSGSAHFIACLLQDAALPQGKAGSCLPHLAGQEGKLQIPWKCSTGQGSQPWIKDLLTALPRTLQCVSILAMEAGKRKLYPQRKKQQLVLCMGNMKWKQTPRLYLEHVSEPFRAPIALVYLSMSHSFQRL